MILDKTMVKSSHNRTSIQPPLVLNRWMKAPPAQDRPVIRPEQLKAGDAELLIVTARAAEEMGFRMVLCGDMNNFGGTAEEMEKEDEHRY